MELPVLGIDIAKKKFDVALLLGNKPRYKVFNNDAAGFAYLSKWLAQQEVSLVHACLEATGNYGEGLALFLYQAGHQVSVVNPARIKGFAQSELARNKTDKVDAALIARFCKALKPDPWQPPAPEGKMLQELVRRLQALKEMYQQENNRRLTASPALAALIRKHLDFLEQEIKATQNLIRDHFNQHPHLKAQRELLLTIPGVGEATAQTLLGELLCLERLENARQLAAYAGLNPQQMESGTSVRGKTRLSKTGNAHLRKGLFLPAIVASRHNPIIAVFCQRLRAAGKAKMAIVGAAMRKLLHLVFGILKSGKPFDPDYATSC